MGLIQNRQGRGVDASGDNIWAEFGSALNAVKEGIEFQRTLAIENGQRTARHPFVPGEGTT